MRNTANASSPSCPDCGHTHEDADRGGICIGCPCTRIGTMTAPEKATPASERCQKCGTLWSDHNWLNCPEKRPPAPSHEAEGTLTREEFVQLICSECVARRQEALTHDAALRERVAELERMAERTSFALTVYADTHLSTLHDVGAWQTHARDVAASVRAALENGGKG